MKRNLNIDIVRAIAILMVLVYHIYAITGITVHNKILNSFLIYGGIVGVALFLILSGYGIYCSLKYQQNKKEKFEYSKYIQKRFLRIAPQYYISLIVLLLFTGNAVYLSKDHIITLVSHIFFFHNLFYTIAGAISGVCWTLALIFQFYLIAPFLFKLMEKKPKLTLVSSFILSIFFKIFIFHFLIAPSNNTNEFLYFNYGNQILTAIHFFVLGMFIAKLHLEEKLEKRKSQLIYCGCLILSIIGLYFVLKLITVNTIPYITNTGIYSDCVMAYFWHNILAIVLGLIIYFINKIDLHLENIVGKCLLFISKYQYGIFIWHLIIITNLKEYSLFMQNLIAWHPFLTYLIYTIICIAIGFIMTELIDKYNWKNLMVHTRKAIYIAIKIGILCTLLFCLHKTLQLIKPLINYAEKYMKNDIIDETPSKKIANHANQFMSDKSSCKYIYLDTEETGYLYFFQIRYYLAPCKSVHYNEYVYTINYTSSEEIYNYLKSKDIDYFIIRDNPILSKELDINFDKENGTIFKKNENATSIQNLFIEIDDNKR